MIVAKFGGSTLSNYKSLRRLYSIVSNKYESKNLIIVCSAFKGITDNLINMAYSTSENQKRERLNKIISFHKRIIHHHDIPVAEISDLFESLKVDADAIGLNNISAAELDLIQSYGERLSSRIIAMALTVMGVKSVALEAKDISLVTNNEYGNARPVKGAEIMVRNSLNGIDCMPVITGFIGITKEGNITTLGRNGTDYTASYIGACTDADEVHFWKDVSSVFDAHPAYIDNPRKIKTITYSQLELVSFFGSKIIHPSTLRPLIEKNIPARIYNYKKADDEGTLICDSMDGDPRIFLSFEEDITKLIIKNPFSGGKLSRYRLIQSLNDYNIHAYTIRNLESKTIIICKNDRRLAGCLGELVDTVTYNTGGFLMAIAGASNQNQAVQYIFNNFTDVDEVIFDRDHNLILVLIMERPPKEKLQELYKFVSVEQ